MSPATVYPGDPITVTGSPINFNPAVHATYTWSLDGNIVSGSGSTTTISTRTLSTGTHTIQGRVSTGPRNFADCTTSITIKSFEPPTISCSPSPSAVSSGESTTITTNAISPQNRPLTYSYTSRLGSIAGNTSTAILSTSGVPPGQIAVKCNATDDKGHTASFATTVSVFSPSAPPPPSAIEPKPVRCSATPKSVRPGPGKVVTLTVDPYDLRSGDHVHWTTTAVPDSLDQDANPRAVDTGSLNSGDYHATAVVTNVAGSRRCDVVFTISTTAPLAPWLFIRPASGLLVHHGTPENRGFALYTYVLMGTRPTNPPDTLRLHNIVKEVLAKGTAEAKGQQAVQQPALPQRTHTPPPVPTGTVIPASQLSVIYVPVDSTPPPAIANDNEAEAAWIVDEGHYDIDRASALLLQPNCLNKTPNCRQKLSGDGPFLVTTLIPLSTNRPSSILIQNLQGTTPEMAGTYVEDFLEIIAVQRNWNSMTFQTLLGQLSLNFDRDGQTMFAVGTAKTQVLAMFGLGKK